MKEVNVYTRFIKGKKNIIVLRYVTFLTKTMFLESAKITRNYITEIDYSTEEKKVRKTIINLN